MKFEEEYSSSLFSITIMKGLITMCSTPKMPKVNSETPVIATPTMADADVTKMKKEQRKKTSNNANKDVKTSTRGIEEEANTSKKKLLGE